MKSIRLLIILLGLINISVIFSQISHGGTPYFLQPSVLRVASSTYFIEMPSFDLKSILREDAVNEGNMRGGYRFAHKFYTNININDGMKTVLHDGTTVKQVGIHSAGAYSINILLRDFEIPEGGKLFIYNTDHSYVLGSYDHRNNSPDKILPIQPVAGESIIVEYSEPANVAFRGNFTITEVNHDYRDFFKREPGTDNSNLSCMPDVLCSEAAPETIRSTVLLMINGSIACSGSLINNTSDDGKPYLLTAVHCLVDNTSIPFPTDIDHYINKAGTIVAFFNYNRPVCDVNIKMKGSEEMSLSGATAHVILEKKDIALLEFKATPPDYYNAFYAGWNMDMKPNSTYYNNLHHPIGAVKKYGMTEETIDLVSTFNFFDPNSFWKVPFWTIGSTDNGSSGSPLFDENNLIIGGLSSGCSVCPGVTPVCTGNDKMDYFYSLAKGWETNNQLKTYLDPFDKGVMQYPGMDPNRINPVIRLANARYTESDSLITSKFDSPNEGFVFGNSNLSTLEFAEEFNTTDFNIENTIEIFGAYLLLPAMPTNNTSDVTISVYSGDTFPETMIYSTSFIPKYLNYSYSSKFHLADKNLNFAPTETFVVFSEPVIVNKKFFISYSINDSTTAGFCVYNTKFDDNNHKNTAWIKDESQGWIPANEYEFNPMKTSLAIHSLVRSKRGDKIEIITTPTNKFFYYNHSERKLTLIDPPGKQGQVSIYSISGQLLEKIPVQQGQTMFILRKQSKGTIGILRISSDNYTCAGKILY